MEDDLKFFENGRRPPKKIQNKRGPKFVGTGI
jgi:hypothetical protein